MLIFIHKDERYAVNENLDVQATEGNAAFAKHIQEELSKVAMCHVPVSDLLQEVAEEHGYTFTIVSDNLEPPGADVVGPWTSS